MHQCIPQLALSRTDAGLLALDPFLPLSLTVLRQRPADLVANRDIEECAVAKKDTGEYSSSKAPDTRKHAEEREGNMVDTRLIPGGAHGSNAPQGMEALDRDAVPNGATNLGQTRYGDSREEPDGPHKLPA
jgi:hypothetical protein